MGKTFEFNKIKVYFKHTDFNGFVHPYNYLEWMSFVREAFFQDLVPNFIKLCNRKIKMVTVKTEFAHTADAAFGDEIIIKIHSENVRRLSFDVLFYFFSNKKTLGIGKQTLTFLDLDSNKPTRIPQELKEAVLLFCGEGQTEIEKN